jgi:CTP synthase (UTP-ammonia lyase)
VLEIGDAEHEETAPEASNLLITQLSCSLNDQAYPIRVLPGTLAHRIYGTEEIVEEFRCKYGLNPGYRDKISKSGLRISGIDSAGEVRMIELSDHRFFIATLFLPQLSSRFDRPHCLIAAFVRAAETYRITGK